MRFLFPLLLLIAFTVSVDADPLPYPPPSKYLPVFPGAEGFGTRTTAGRGGQIFIVNTLELVGTNRREFTHAGVRFRTGSLPEAVAGEPDNECLNRRPRTVVFGVAGTIDLSGLPDGLKITKPYLTIAGQTAPSPGIQIVGNRTLIDTHDVLIQHLRFRAGGREAVRNVWKTAKSYWKDLYQDADLSNNYWVNNSDNIHYWCNCLGLTPKQAAKYIITMNRWRALQIGRYMNSVPRPEPVYNIVIDHCSFSWGMDEVITIEGPPGSRDITISNCIIAEGLNDAWQMLWDERCLELHSNGLLVGSGVSNVSLIRNLFIHNYARNPRLNAGASTVMLNNVIYNCGDDPPGYCFRSTVVYVDRDANSGNSTLASIQGNVYIPGPEEVDCFLNQNRKTKYEQKNPGETHVRLLDAEQTCHPIAVPRPT